MFSCRQVMEQLWDYLDGELPPDQVEEFAAHLAECARCYPQYRFEFAFLEAVARQRDRSPGPPRALLQRLRLLMST